jgi:hypothetical protein
MDFACFPMLKEEKEGGRKSENEARDGSGKMAHH